MLIGVNRDNIQTQYTNCLYANVRKKIYYTPLSTSSHYSGLFTRKNIKLRPRDKRTKIMREIYKQTTRKKRHKYETKSA